MTNGHQWVLTDEVERFWRQVDTSAGPDACWLWLGARDQGGYGVYRVKRDGRGWITMGAHRFAWEQANGLVLPPRASGVTLDHKCHTYDGGVCPGGVTCLHRRCVNPAHLERVTRAENTRRRHSRLAGDR